MENWDGAKALWVELHLGVRTLKLIFAVCYKPPIVNEEGET